MERNVKSSFEGSDEEPQTYWLTTPNMDKNKSDRMLEPSWKQKSQEEVEKVTGQEERQAVEKEIVSKNGRALQQGIEDSISEQKMAPIYSKDRKDIFRKVSLSLNKRENILVQFDDLNYSAYDESIGHNIEMILTNEEGVEKHLIKRPKCPPYPCIRRPHYDYRLPVPSPQLYWDNYHHRLFPRMIPPIYRHSDSQHEPYALPQPMGILLPHHFSVLGATLHDIGYVDFNRQKVFTRYLQWFLEISDPLFHKICPSDLNDQPCEWDELQGGCPMLRLCKSRHKYPHPHLGRLEICKGENRQYCPYVHDVGPTCRFLARGEICPVAVRGEFCNFGHDFESARKIATVRYWDHRDGARKKGSEAVVKRDLEGRKTMSPIWAEVVRELEEKKQKEVTEKVNKAKEV